MRSFRQLRESLLDPDAHIADGYGGVTVVTKTGRTISGVARDNTNYAIQILDAHGDIHRLLKADLREVVFQQRLADAARLSSSGSLRPKS